jgi:hypothetical protein
MGDIKNSSKVNKTKCDKKLKQELYSVKDNVVWFQKKLTPIAVTLIYKIIIDIKYSIPGFGKNNLLVNKKKEFILFISINKLEISFNAPSAPIQKIIFIFFFRVLFYNLISYNSRIFRQVQNSNIKITKPFVLPTLILISLAMFLGSLWAFQEGS